MSDTDIVISELMFERIRSKKDVLDTKRPLPKDAVNRLREEMRLAHTYHSNAIEGNTLTLQETKLVLETGVTIGGKSLAEHLEVTGNAKAFDLLEELAKVSKPVDHVLIQQLHEIVTRGLLEDAGRYRNQNVRIAGAKKSPPDFSKVLGLMDKFLQRLSRMRAHPVVTAAYLHHGLVEIHPFADGNGRVARLLSNLFLMRRGYPPAILKKEDRKKYYTCLGKADGGDLSPLVNFIGKAMDESLTIYLAMFGGKEELLPLKELAKTVPYSQEYLSLRARQGILDAVKMGRTWHSSKRALEDYVNEHGGK